MSTQQPVFYDGQEVSENYRWQVIPHKCSGRCGNEVPAGVEFCDQCQKREWDRTHSLSGFAAVCLIALGVVITLMLASWFLVETAIKTVKALSAL